MQASSLSLPVRRPDLMYLHIVYEVKSPAKETAADPTLTNLDYSQAEMAVAARRDPCSCTHVPQMGHNAADGV